MPLATPRARVWHRLIEHQMGAVVLDEDDECAQSVLTLGNSFFSALWLLFKTLIGGGEDLVNCLEDSGQAASGAHILLEVYEVLAVILLVNLLIALMSKTFDTVHENVTTK